MTAAPVSRQQLVTVWVAQMVGTLAVAGVVLVFVRQGSIQLGTLADEWKQWTMLALLAACVPALLYLRHYRVLLLQDDRLERERGRPHQEARATLRRGLTLGGALCEIPMALGLVQLFLGGETRWFLGATMIAIALRLSYRPFLRHKAAA